MLSENELKQREYFDSIAKQRKKNLSEDRLKKYNLDDVYSVLTNLPNHHSVLEIGCGDGSGGFTEHFVSHGLSVTFMDISSEAVSYLSEKLKKKGLAGFRPLSGTFKDVAPEIKGEVFDVIFFGDTLHHLTEEETVSLLNDLVPFMHMKTTIVAFEPNGHWPLWRLMPILNKDFVWEVEKNIVHCTPSGFKRKFKAAGMRLKEYSYQRILPQFLMDMGEFFRYFNRWLTKIPIIKMLSSYTIVVGESAHLP